MAVSGNETTRIGAWLHGVGKRVVITAKAAAGGPTFKVAYAVNANTTIGTGSR